MLIAHAGVHLDNPKRALRGPLRAYLAFTAAGRAAAAVVVVLETLRRDDPP
ncbi:MAG TPA: hypothetical protein VJV79_28685 [Polyangiaceae bacterium]|nr:hypothetical protein [Polyangiaceae bacterium]